MDKQIKEYSDALKEYVEASKEEVVARDRVQKSRYKLHKAKEALRFMESDMLDNSLWDTVPDRDNHSAKNGESDKVKE